MNRIGTIVVGLNLLLGLLLAVGSFSMPSPVLAVEPDEILSDAGLEARARDLSAGLRCVVCQNQSIDDSAAPLAKDLRLLVRERLLAGDSDTEVVSYIVARYGEFVLLRPSFTWHNLLLWMLPPVIFFLAVTMLYRAHKRRRSESGAVASVPTLSDAEQRRLAELLQADARSD